jgi:hypothetical protein
VELEQELRTTSDSLLLRLDRLRELELEKRELSPGTERFLQIARDIEILAGAVLAKTIQQEQLADKSVEVREETGQVARPIEEVPAPREASIVLAEWREAERRLASTAPDSSERDLVKAEVDRLREEYRRSYDAVSTERDPN